MELLIVVGAAFGLPLAATAQEPTFTAITDSPISESWAFSVAGGDYDGDGFIDLLAVEEYTTGLDPGVGRIYLFRNRRDGSFEKSTLDGSAYVHTGYIHGALWGDYDNDGRPDILVSGGGLWDGPNPHILMHHDEDGTFSRSGSPTFPIGNSQSALWGDFDNDGWLDIFAGYWTKSPTPTVTDILWRNNGDGSGFTDARAPGITQLNGNDDSAMAATTGDFNGDGSTDIIVTTIHPGRSRLYLNNGDLSFNRVLVTPSAANGYGNGVAVADYDNDGDLDFLTVSKSGSGSWTCACDGSLSGFTLLWRNNGSGEFEQVVAGDLGQSEIIGANGAAWADYNNDGWLDVVLFRGIYSNGRGQDPSDLLYRNNGDGTFTGVMTGPIVNEIGDARSGAWGDIDNDGDMDLVVANYNWFAPAGSNVLPVLYRNEGNNNHWLKVSLTGTQGNRDAIGAKVRVKATIAGKEIWQLREIRCNTGWIASQNDMRPHFGLGDATVAQMVRVEWPSGTVQEWNDVPANQILRILEPPRLSVESASRLSWPASAEGFQLESAATIDGPWSAAAEAVVADGNRMRVTIQTDGVARFYRLSQP
jgi:enediyne biosynthesis protein E4